MSEMLNFVFFLLCVLRSVHKIGKKHLKGVFICRIFSYCQVVSLCVNPGFFFSKVCVDAEKGKTSFQLCGCYISQNGAWYEKNEEEEEEELRHY